MGRAYQNRKDSIAKTAAAKSKVYSKYGRQIYVVAKQGGVDPDANLQLRSLIDNAKKDQVPAHVIEKAIDKAKGGAGEDYSPARYAGYGPGNCMMIVDRSEEYTSELQSRPHIVCRLQLEKKKNMT